MPIQLLSLPALATYLLVTPGPASLPSEIAVPLSNVVGTVAPIRTSLTSRRIRPTRGEHVARR